MSNSLPVDYNATRPSDCDLTYMWRHKSQFGYVPSAPLFWAPLQNTTVPTSVISGATATVARSSTAYIIDWQDIARLVKANEPRFMGARRVEFLMASCNSFTGATLGVISGGVYAFSGTCTNQVTFSNAFSGTLAQNASARTYVTFTAGTATLTMVTSGVANAQLELISGNANQVPSEYVDGSVASGAGANGVQYFNTTNGNTNSGSTVIAGTGTAIVTGTTGVVTASPVNSGGPWGWHNTLAKSDVLGTTTAIRRTMTNVGWVATNLTVGTATGFDGVGSAGASLTATAGNGQVLFTTVLTAAIRTYYAFVRRKTGTGTINMTKDGGATWTALTLTTDYKVFSVVTANVANPVVGFQIVTSADAIEVDFNTIEAVSTYPSPAPIPVNVGLTVETMVYPVTNINGIQGTVYFEYTQNHANTGQVTLFGCSQDASNGLLLICSNNTGAFTMRKITAAAAFDGAITVGALTAGTTYKVCGSWGPSGVKVYVNQVKGGTVNADTTTAILGANIQVGANLAIGQSTGQIRNLKIYPTQLSDGAATAL